MENQENIFIDICERNDKNVRESRTGFIAACGVILILVFLIHLHIQYGGRLDVGDEIATPSSTIPPAAHPPAKPGRRQATSHSAGQYISFILTLSSSASAKSRLLDQPDRAMLIAALAKAIPAEPTGLYTE